MMLALILLFSVQSVRIGPRQPGAGTRATSSTDVNSIECGILPPQMCSHFKDGVDVTGRLIWPAGVIPAIIDIDLEDDSGVVVDSVQSGPLDQFRFAHVPVIDPEPTHGGRFMTYFISINTDGLDIVRQQLSLSTDNFTGAFINVPLRPIPGITRYLETVTSFEDEMQVVPKAASDAVDKALADTRKGDLKKVAADLRIALAADSNYYDANLEMGMLAEKNKQYDEAQRYFDHAIEVNPASMRARVALGERAFANKNYEKAAELLGEAVRLGSPNAEVYLELGSAYFESGKMEMAEMSLLRALSISPALGQANRALYAVYLRLGELDRGLAQLQTYLKHHPDAPDRKKVQGLIDKIDKQLHPPQ